MVVVEDQLYVRAFRGRASGWFQVAVAQQRGRIRVATIDCAVKFTVHDGPTGGIDTAYEFKYGDHGGLVTHRRTSEATLRVEPAP